MDVAVKSNNCFYEGILSVDEISGILIFGGYSYEVSLQDSDDEYRYIEYFEFEYDLEIFELDCDSLIKELKRKYTNILIEPHISALEVTELIDYLNYTEEKAYEHFKHLGAKVPSITGILKNEKERYSILFTTDNFPCPNMTYRLLIYIKNKELNYALYPEKITNHDLQVIACSIFDDWSNTNQLIAKLPTEISSGNISNVFLKRTERRLQLYFN